MPEHQNWRRGSRINTSKTSQSSTRFHLTRMKSLSQTTSSLTRKALTARAFITMLCRWIPYILTFYRRKIRSTKCSSFVKAEEVVKTMCLTNQKTLTITAEKSCSTSLSLSSKTIESTLLVTLTCLSRI